MESTIILIDNPNKINEINQLVRDESSKIFSLNYETHKALDELKIKHEIGENFLSIEELDDLDKSLIELTLTWHQNPDLKSYVMYDSINLGQLLEMEIVQYFIPFLLSIKSTLKILDMEKPTTVFAVTKINEFLENYCKKNNIRLNTISVSKKAPLPLDNFLLKINLLGFPIYLKISRNRFISIKNSFEKFLYSVFNLYENDSKSNQNSILLFDFNSANYSDLLSELSKTNKKIVLLNTRRPAIWNFSSLKIILKTRCKIINFQKIENEIKSEFKQKEKVFFSNLNNLWEKTDLLETIFSIDSTSFWKSIQPSFSKILHTRFKESILRFMIFESLLKKSNITTILEWAETAQEERELIHIAKKYDIPIVFLQHALAAISEPHAKFGMFLTHFSHPMLSDIQAVWGKSAENYASSKNNPLNIKITGSPRHDKYFKNSSSLTNKPMILFGPTGPSGISCKYSTTKKILEFYDTVRKTCEISQSIPNKDFVIKPHPSTVFSKEVVDIAYQVDNTIKISYTSDVFNLIKDCELLITTNNSTIAVDAMMLGKPVISIQTENWSLDEPIAKSGAIVSLTDPKDILDSINKIYNDYSFKKSLLENSKKFLDLHFSNQGNASKILAETLNKISD